ncbi:MAG: TIGR03364 family FAD-dependent oxidoreductase [Acidimicrobiales bacterium]
MVIVGGGVLGTMHAWHARQRNIDVVQLEREAGPRGASVRNFGLVWVSGRAVGPELDLALRARQLWAEIGDRVPGTGFRAHGSLTVVRTEAERAVVQAAVERDDAGRRGFRLLGADEVRAHNPAVAGDIVGALLCTEDAIVEPRLTLAAIRDALAGTGYEFLPGRQAVQLADGGVRDHTGTWHRADEVVLCTGAAHIGIGAEDLSRAPLRRCRLQMMETAPWDGPALTTALADGDSLRYYPAFGVPALADLPPQSELATRYRIQLLMVQRLDGGLTIGDTHAYDEPFPFDLDEAAYDDLRARAGAVLGRPLPPTVRRWAGVYSQTTDDSIYHRQRVRPGVTVVTGPGGRGMTLSPAIAEASFTTGDDDD